MQPTLEQRTLKLSIVMTLSVASLGVLFGLLSGSQSILFDGVFSTIDAGMSLLSLWVSRLLMRESSPRFQHGYWHLEPLVAALNGAILTLLCFYAFLNALRGLMEGGRVLAFDLAIVYALVVAVVCFAMAAYQRRVNRRVGSEFLRIDAQGWLMAGLITAALLLAFVIALLLEGSAAASWIPYIDSLLLACLTLAFLPVPIGIVRRAMKEVLMVAPSALDREVRGVMEEVMRRDGLLAYHSHVAKTGRVSVIEIHIVTRPNFAAEAGVAALDEIRREIDAGLSIPAEKRWFTLAFTADPRWA